jgi:capsid protein
VTYEALTNDYSNVNFSSGRLGWIEFQRNIDMWRWHLMVPHMCIPTWRWFTEAAAVAGMGSDKVVSQWTAPRREMIDPAKEAEGLKNQIRCGLMSQSEAIRENGRDPDEVYQEIAGDNAKLDDLELVLDSDPRQDIKLAEAKVSAANNQTNDASQNKKKSKA